MRIGAVFPTYDIGNDPVVIGDYVQAVEGMGFDHLLVIDHVLGVSEKDYPDVHGPYRYTHAFHEPFTLIAYLAGLTERIEFFTSVVVLPQRQTVLVAKQAAEVDVLSGGRLRLGVGVGWHDVEFEGLGENFDDRGPRIEEQIAVMRALWTQDLVDFEGQWHTIRKAGINPLPVQRPIPIWFGGEAPPVIRRVVRMGDGWMPRTRVFGGWDPKKPRDFDPDDIIDQMHKAAEEAGRDPASIGIEQMARIGISDDPDDWASHGRLLKRRGGTHFSVHTLDAGLETVDDHLAVLQRFKDVATDL
jgi:probable F420-dependent oxidoreductase